MAVAHSLTHCENSLAVSQDEAQLYSTRRHTHGDCVSKYGTVTGILPDLNSCDEGQNSGDSHGPTGHVIPSPAHDSHDETRLDTENTQMVSKGIGADSEGVVDQCPLILITLIVMLTVCATRLNSLLMDQYLYQMFARDVFGNASTDTSSHPCVNISGSGKDANVSTEEKLVHKVQDMTSAMSSYLDLTSYGVGMISNMFLGTFSNVMSRRLLLLIPTTGFMLRCSLVSIIVHWNLDVHWFFLGYGVDGLCGNVVGIILGTLLYTSDITPRDRKRTLGIAVVEATKGAVGGAFYAVTGQLIERTGYMIPACSSAGLLLIAMLIICTLPNRKPTPVDQNVELKSFKAAFRHMFSPFTASRGQRVKRLIFLAASALFLTLLARVGIEKVQNLYLMNLPFCFDAVTLGWLLFARDLAQHIFAILAAFLFLRCLPGIILAMIGNLSAIAGFLMYAFAENDGEVFSVPALGLGQQLTLTIIRGEVSRLLGPEHQGPLFASLALLESIALAVSSPMLLSIYRATLDLFTGFAFLIAALILFVSIVMMGVFHVIWTRHIRHIQYQTLEVQIQTASNEAIEQ